MITTPSPDQPMEQLPHIPKPFAVGCKNKTMVPTDQLAAHSEVRSIGVDCRFLIEEVHSHLLGVDNDNRLSKGRDMYNGAVFLQKTPTVNDRIEWTAQVGGGVVYIPYPTSHK